MTKLDDHANKLRPGLLDETGRLAREAWADIGNTYQQILTQHASVNPPAAVEAPSQQASVNPALGGRRITTEIAQAGREDVGVVVIQPEPDMGR
jgi:hypothetical protein